VDALSASVIFDRSHPAIIAELEKLAATFDPDRVWATKNGQPYTLSSRVWDAGQETRAQIDAMVRRALVTGQDAIELARQLEVYLTPSLQPVRDAKGRLVRDSPQNQRRAVVHDLPGRGGRGSHAARRLARTEIARAHAEATQASAEANPWVTGLRYNVSPGHTDADECDERAHRNGGIYPVKECPLPPRHPHCRCFVTSVVTDDTDAVVDQLRADFWLAEEAAPSDLFGMVPNISGRDLFDALPDAKRAKMQANLETVIRDVETRTGYKLTRLDFIDDGLEGNIAHAQAVQKGDHRLGINVKSEWWGLTPDERKASAGRAYFVNYDDTGPIYHEFGHIQYYDAGHIRPQYLTDPELDAAVKVSRYAATDDHEFMAEVFSSVMTHGNDAFGKPLADDVIAIYRAKGGVFPKGQP
jgi:SPP1 gp7 family putative phage head morphogenesis protein